MLPHHPFLEQQLPHSEPWQVKPLPHLASVLTLSVERLIAPVGAVLDVVPEGLVKPLQLPKADWQPAPQ